MKADMRDVRPGFEVYEPAGKLIGAVVAVEPDAMHVKTEGLFAKDLYIPPTAIAEVEERRVELNVPKEDLNGRGWEHPPAMTGDHN
jgi:hypothetical protein